MSEKAKQIRDGLLKSGRPELASIMNRYWECSAAEYSEMLWQEQKAFPDLEPELIHAFDTEFQNMGVDQEKAQSCIDSLQRTRFLQTATHLTASEGPTFLALHQLALLGMPKEETYLVAAFSGVPFANAAWSGCLNFSTRFELESFINEQMPDFSDLKKADSDRNRDAKSGGFYFDRRISLIPGKMRDGLVYQSEVPQKLVDLKKYFQGNFVASVPETEVGHSFPHWASRFSENQLTRIFPEKNIQYFDLNEVVRYYLIEVLKNDEHPVYKILFDVEVRNRVFAEFSNNISFFSVEVEYKNSLRQESLIYERDSLNSANYRLYFSPENVIQELEKGVLCPGLLLSFFILSFINGLTCLGSFEQVEYLATFKRKWLDMDFLDKDLVRSVQTAALTCGRCMDESGQPVFPLDLLQGLEWEFKKEQTIGDLMKPLLPRWGISA